MPDRLTELLRQRELLQTHLAWLDREIANARAGAASSPPASPAQILETAPASISFPYQVAPRAVAPGSAGDVSRSDVEADEMLARYRPDAGTLRADVRKGCLLYFFGALAVVALGLSLLLFFYRR
jgi:hypothetical protein